MGSGQRSSLNEALSWEQFRGIVGETYYASEPTLGKAGAAGGHLWRFIREMKAGDLVVVPRWSDFYVAQVTGPATFDKSKIEDDTAYRRSVQWLNAKQPISRRLARAALISRMKVQGASANASDLVDEIRECLALTSEGHAPTFQTDLHTQLVRDVLRELHKGRIEDFGFERLIKAVLLGLGATDARIVPRNQD